MPTDSERDRRPAQDRSWTIRNPADLGRAIAGVRDAKGLTQAELAAQVGIGRSYLAQLEAGASQLVLERSLRALRRMGAGVTISLPGDDERR